MSSTLSKKQYFPAIDLLRFFICFSIAFVYHYGQLFAAFPYGDKSVMHYLYVYAYYGVEVFFAISGFVLYFSYYNRIRDGKLSFRTFVVGRIIRIYPVMILTVVAAAAGQWISLGVHGHVAALNIGDGRNTLVAFVLSLFGVQCGWIANHDSMSINGPAWFVCIIMICYVFFFAILKYCKKNRMRENCCFGLLILFGICLYVKPLELPLLYQSCGRGYLNFFCGVLIAELYCHINNEKRRFLCLTGSTGGLALFAIMFKLNNLGDLNLAVSMIAVPAVLLLVTNLKWLNKISSNRGIAYLGKISFDVYLWNIPIAIWIFLIKDSLHIEIDFWGRDFFVVHMILGTIIAILTYEIYEKKMTRVLKAWLG